MTADDLKRLHERLDQIVAERAERGEVLARIETRAVGVELLCRNHNGDIRALQQWQARLTGALGLLTFAVVFVQPFAFYALTRLLD